MNTSEFYKTHIAWDKNQMERSDHADLLPSTPRFVNHSSLNASRMNTAAVGKNVMVQKHGESITNKVSKRAIDSTRDTTAGLPDRCHNLHPLHARYWYWANVSRSDVAVIGSNLVAYQQFICINFGIMDHVMISQFPLSK